MSRYKLCYISMILAYLIVGYLLILSDLIAVDGKVVLDRALAITAVGLWIVGFWYQEYLDEKKVARSRADEWLRVISMLPFAVLGLPFVALIAIYCFVRNMVNSMKRKCKPLLEKGFVLRRGREGKKRCYLLTKNSMVIKVAEFDTYEISEDGGETFVPINASTLFPEDHKKQVEELIKKYKTCDIRDREEYEPTRKIVEILSWCVN